MIEFGRYNKTIAALVIGILGWGGVVVNSDAASVTASEWLALGVAVATAVGVWSVKNSPPEA